MNLLEQGVWDRIKEGDIKSFELIFQTYYKGLCTYAYDFLRNREDSEEVVFDLFTDIWSDRMQINIHTSLKSYLFRSTHNRCINLIKRLDITRQRKLQYASDILIMFNEVTFTKEEFALDHLIDQELERDISQAIETLPPQCKEIFNMSRFEQMKICEIAAKLGISESTVKTQLVRAIDKLREILGENLK